MAEQNEIVAKLILDSQQANESVKSMKAQLKEASLALVDVKKRFGDTSPEAIALAKHIADLKDQMSDAKEVVDLFDPGAKFQVFGNVLRTVAGGFSALTGVMGLFGEESENVAKTLARVQSALAVTEGINTIVDSAKDFQRLGAVIQQSTIFMKANNAVTKVAAVTQRLFGVAVDETAVSFKVLKGVIASLGIGLLLVAIGEIISLVQDWTSETERNAEAQKELNDELVRLSNEGLKAGQNFINQQEKLNTAKAKAQGKSDEEIFKIQEKYQEERIKSQQRHYEDVKGIDAKAGEESRAQVENLQTDLQVMRLNFQTEQAKKAEEEEKKRQEKAKQNAEKRKQELKESLERERSAEEELRKMRQDNYLAEEKNTVEAGKSKILFDAENERKRINELRISEDLRQKLLEEARRKERDSLKTYEETVEAEQKEKDATRLQTGLQNVLDQAAIFQEQVAAQNELRKEIRELGLSEFEIQLQDLDDNYKRQLEIVGKNEALQNELVEAYEKQRSQIVFAQNQQRLNIVANILGQASKLFGEQTAAGKALAIAEATINTYAGATAALRSKVPFPEPYATAIRIAQAGLIIATGLKSIREIAKTKVPNGGGGSVADVSANISSASAPVPTTPTVSTTQLDQQTINDLGDQSRTQRAYVVESDITDEQERQNRLKRASILGG
jgi:hypothetical protein